MKKLALVACVVVGATSAVASGVAEAREICDPIGSWYGYYAPGDPGSELIGPRWISTISGMSKGSGAAVLELNGGFDSTFTGYGPAGGPLFPTAVAGTLIRGSWKRTSDNTFAVSALAMVRDAQGNTVYIVKMVGTDTLIENCNTVQVDVSLQILKPDFEQWFDLGPQTTHYGYRIVP